MSNDLFRNKYRIPSARANWHDYNNGCYFITICTEKREHYFGEIKDNKISLSQIGEVSASYLENLHLIYNDVAVLSYVIMPNHIHLIIAIEKYNKWDGNKIKDDNVNETMQDIAKHCGRLSHIISRFKSFVTRHARDNDIPFMWQTRFHDRILRNYEEFVVKDHYIKNNISNWNDDDYYSPPPL